MYSTLNRIHPHHPGRLALKLVVALVCGLVFCFVSNDAIAADKPTITLYSGQHQQTVRLLVNAFEEASGIHVKVRHGDGPELANTIIREDKATPADVFITENSPELQHLQEKHLLAKINNATLKQIPAKYSSAKGYWVGVVARENVLTYNPNMVKKSALPASILDLADPKWKGMIGIHLTSPDIMPLIRTVALVEGHDKALAWLQGIKRNAKLYQHSSGLVAAVNNGDVAIGISNSYYYYRLREQMGADKIVSRVYHFANHDPGGLINVSGASVLKYAPHPQAAQQFVAFLVSNKAQQLLANSRIDFEYPLRHGTPANPQLKPLASLSPPQVTVTQLGDDREALQLLQEAGLL